MILSKNLATYFAIRKTIKTIKKNYELSFRIGRELSLLYYKIYLNLKADENFNLDYVYNIITSCHEYDDMILSNILHYNIDFPKYFSKVNIKLLQLNIENISAFMRGYYLNEMTLYSTNIIQDNSENLWFVLYDNQYHYLLFLYNYLNNNYTSGYVKLLLNDGDDPYSINDDSNELGYKLIFQKKKYDFVDSIRLLLDFFYFNKIITYNSDDDYVFKIYNKYINI